MTEVLYQNVRGLRTKVNEFAANLINSSAQIVCLTETWLSDAFNSSEFLHMNFVSHRRDRNYIGTKTTRGGGCWLLHRPNIKSSRLFEFELNVNFLEDLWVRIYQPNFSIYVCVVYITPMEHNKQLYERFFDKLRENISKLESTDRLIILGDFNLSEIQWHLNSDNFLTPTNIKSDQSIDLINSMQFGGLNQFNHVLNHRQEILDLVLSNDTPSSLNIQRGFPLVNEDNYHPTISINLSTQIKLMKTDDSHKKLNFRKANYTQINEDLKLIDWSFLHSLPLDIAVTQFYNTINPIIEKNVPKRGKKGKYPFWYSSELKSILKSKEVARRKYIKSGKDSHYANYSSIRAQSKLIIDECYQQYLTGLQNNIKDNIKLFWSYTKKRKQSNTYPSVLKYENNCSDDPKAISEMFSNFFMSTYKSQNPNIDSIDTSNTTSNDLSENPSVISVEEVSNMLSKIDINKNGGPDRIPNIFLRYCASQLALPLSIIFNKSLSSGVFPTTFKEAFVTPVFKSGDSSLITNYRPISMLNSIALIFEKIVHKQLLILLKDKISQCQHGFCKNKSTGTNLTHYINYISRALDSGLEVHAIYTDFSKAFDTVNHKILIKKLYAMGIRGRLLEWIKSYLKNRKMSVTFNGSKSDPFSPPSGVPQGSVLGPLLFNIFINDLPSKLKCNSLFFADDLKMFTKITQPIDCNNLQSDINTLNNWCNENGLLLNINKCKYIPFSNRIVQLQTSYHINGITLEQVSSIRDLGVIFDSKLRFDLHIEEIIKKSYRMLGFIMRATSKFNNIKCINMLYNALVRSNLEYNSFIWSPHYESQSHQIERIQKNYTRQLAFKFRIDYNDYTDRLERLGLLSLRERRTYFDMLQLHKIVHSPDSALFAELNIRNNPYSNRHNSLFTIPASRSDYGLYKCPLNRYQKTFTQQFNEIEIENASLGQFKGRIIEALKNKRLEPAL